MSTEEVVSSGRLYGVLLTYRRQAMLADTLRRIARQSRSLDKLLVVDCEASVATEKVVQEVAREAHFPIVYRATAENRGSAGGWAFGMRCVLEEANDSDWIMPLDDDDPPVFDHEFEEMERFAAEARSRDQSIGGVGVVGARFNWWTGLINRVPDEDLAGAVEVDFVGNGHVPLYSVAAVRSVGVFDEALFFGYTEVEYGLRLKHAGYQILAHGALWFERRNQMGRRQRRMTRSRTCRVSWSRYYVTRNYLYIMLRFRRLDLACKQVLLQCGIKPFLTLFVRPLDAYRGFKVAVQATWDAARGQMGCNTRLKNWQAQESLRRGANHEETADTLFTKPA